jgi:DNA primase catalytic core
MSKSFDDQHIEELRQRADLVQYIQRTLPLKKRGNRWVGLCPFHGDSSPSLYVTPQMGIYKCFACGAGGDIFKFAMEREKLSFPESVEHIAEWCGYVLPEKKIEKVDPKRKGALELLEFATRHFQQRLGTEFPIQEYLQKRGIHPALCQEFGIGYAKASWDDFSTAAKQAGFSESMLIETGMCAQKEQRIYDRFRARILIPIRNIQGQVIAFGGRTLDPQENAKYLNSPETDYYHKSDVLFGLSHSKREISTQGSFIVVEGYMDFLQLWSHGFKNAVAVSGTALTPQHAKALSKYARKAFLLFDGDKAGQNAINRSIPTLLKENVEIRIPKLPAGEDPDSFLLQEGPQEFAKILQDAELWIDWICEQPLESDTPESLSERVTHLRELLQSISDPLIREGYTQRAANRMGIPIRHFQGSAPPLSNPKRTPQQTQRTTAGFDGPEKRLIELALHSTELRQRMAQELQPEWLSPGPLLDLLDSICAWELNLDFELNRFLQSLEPRVKDWCERLLVEDRCEDPELLTKEYLQIITRIQVQSIERKWKALKTQGTEAQKLWAELQREGAITTLHLSQRKIFATSAADPQAMEQFQDLAKRLAEILKN